MRKANFFPATGVTFATFTSQRPSFTENPSSAFTRAQKEGLRYEKKAHEYLKKLLIDARDINFELKISPWIMFKCKHDASTRIRFCQPDAVLISKDETRIILIEIKYQHTNEAWKQLRLLYEPILKFIYPKASIACLEICSWFDPHASFQEHYYYSENPLEALSERLGVHVYHPRKI